MQGSTVTHALDCLALITFELGPAAVAPLACTQVPSFPGTTPTAGDWQGGGSCHATATGNLLQHVLSILKEHEPDLEVRLATCCWPSPPREVLLCRNAQHDRHSWCQEIQHFAVGT
jgi:hypothetical protein